ncbi:eCIS core domain-containing protein [Streptomyces sp. CA-106131]|uniref:eCIS core domain-containing protein n=1 Tax=Streptomyces sp. CA-106131 TaxID=3240045 RepID=UPI003D920376
MAQHARKSPRDRTGVVPLLPAAKREAGPVFDGPDRQRLEAGVGADFSQMRVHGGPASAEAAARLGARAFTIGQDVYLGAEAHRLPGVARTRLLVHEAVHTAQQGTHSTLPDTLPVSAPGSAAEREAHDIADAVTDPSPSARLVRHITQGGGPAVSRLPGPIVQRDLAGSYAIDEDAFDLNLKTESHPGAKSGMSGTITFTPGTKAPDSALIKLLQVVRVIDSGTDKDYVWAGGEANRNKAMTTANPTTEVKPGFFVDHSAAAAKVRTAKKDPTVSPYYRDYWPNATRSQDGAKKGRTIKSASLWDYPGSSGAMKFRFETAAKASDTGHIYGVVKWGFDLTDPAKGTVSGEFAKTQDAQTSTFDAAVKAFDEFYRNPGSSKAP